MAAGWVRLSRSPLSTRDSMLAKGTRRPFLHVPFSLNLEHCTRPPFLPPAITIDPPHAAHRIKPENGRIGRPFVGPNAFELLTLIFCAACQVPSSTMRRCGASAVRYSDLGLGREIRRPVFGSFNIRTLF